MVISPQVLIVHKLQQTIRILTGILACTDYFPVQNLACVLPGLGLFIDLLML